MMTLERTDSREAVCLRRLITGKGIKTDIKTIPYCITLLSRLKRKLTVRNKLIVGSDSR